MTLVGLSELMEIFNRLERQAVGVNAAQCARARHRKSTCTRCADACPTGAISWEESLTVDSEKCTACGACAAVCPTGALEARSPVDGELLARVSRLAGEKKQVVFACPRVLEESGVHEGGLIALRCLARLHEAVLVGAVVAGAESLLLVNGACAGCPQGKALAVVRESVERANRLLEAFGQPRRVLLRPNLPQDLLTDLAEGALGEGLSRRGFFALLARQTVRVGTVATDTVLSSHGLAEKKEEPKKGELPQVLPAKRALLLHALKQLGEPVAARLDMEGWATFGYTEACTGCQMCGFFCPTGALRKIEGEGKLGVSFAIAACTDCGLCTDICYKDAVEMQSGADMQAVLDETVELFWMGDASEPPWKGSRDGRLKQSVLKSLGL